MIAHLCLKARLGACKGKQGRDLPASAQQGWPGGGEEGEGGITTLPVVRFQLVQRRAVRCGRFRTLRLCKSLGAFFVGLVWFEA